MTLAIHHALRTSERATQFIGRFQTAPRLIRETSFHSCVDLNKIEILGCKLTGPIVEAVMLFVVNRKDRYRP